MRLLSANRGIGYLSDLINSEKRIHLTFSIPFFFHRPWRIQIPRQWFLALLGTTLHLIKHAWRENWCVMRERERERWLRMVKGEYSCSISLFLSFGALWLIPLSDSTFPSILSSLAIFHTRYHIPHHTCLLPHTFPINSHSMNIFQYIYSSWMSTLTCSNFLPKSNLTSFDNDRYLLAGKWRSPQLFQCLSLFFLQNGPQFRSVHGNFIELYDLDGYLSDDFNAREYQPIRTHVFDVSK